MSPGYDRFDYQRVAASRFLTPEGWDAFVREVLVERWLAAYRASTPWTTDVLEIGRRELVFLFDAAPTRKRVEGVDAGDRVIAVWGRSSQAERRRDRKRRAGFLPHPSAWSRVQATSLNRGRSAGGRVWRRMEDYAARHPGTPLFVRPLYVGPSWGPAALDYGLLAGETLWSERFLISR